jgi:HEAT repeats
LVAHGGRAPLEAIARALGRWEPPAYRGAREVAFSALVKAGDPRVPRWFVEALLTERPAKPLDSDGATLKRLMSAGDVEGAAAMEAIAEVAHDADPSSVAQVCSWLGEDPVEPLLASLDIPATRTGAALALGALHDNRAVAPLRQHLGDDDPEIRLAVVQALGLIKDPSALGDLLRSAQDSDYAVRVAALAALDGFGSIAVAASVVAASGSLEGVLPQLAPGDVTEQQSIEAAPATDTTSAPEETPQAPPPEASSDAPPAPSPSAGQAAPRPTQPGQRSLFPRLQKSLRQLLNIDD